MIDGLILAGGADIDPSAYDQQPHSETADTVPERDAFEVALARAAVERDLPVLGICRGMQLINVACGGTLLQHLPERYGHHEHRRVVGSFDGADHDVTLNDGSLAASAAGEITHATKSHHHQGVDRLGDGLTVSGVSGLDDLPEAIEMPDRTFVLGVQWHPEADLGQLGRGRAGGRRYGRFRVRAFADRPCIYSPRSAAVQGDQSNRLGDGGGRSQRPARAQACERSTAGDADRRLRRAARPVRRSAPLGARDVAACALQMWAYLAAYKSPHDDPDSQARRVHVDYPIVADRALGLGELPTVRLQEALASRGASAREWRAHDRVLVWAHWSWFIVPHGSLAYILVRHRARFARAAVLTYAVFDIGASVYWLLPTAPPWYAAQMAAGVGESAPLVRRMMVEYGELFWRDSWGSLYSVFGGNPLAAMPSLHFATSVMAALLLAEVGPVAGALGFGYAAMLGFALVYLGEHYVVDLLGGLALTVGVRRLGPRAASAVARVGRAVATLEEMAHEAA